MTQLILDTVGVNLAMPESRKGGYTCQNEPIFTDTVMASGRLTREVQGNVYKLTYQYGYLTSEQKEPFLAACEKGWREPISCGFLLPSGVIAVSDFLVTSFSYPKFMWAAHSGGETSALWGDFRVELREVEPHD